jgi:predicted O-methyltransferase YrrM
VQEATLSGYVETLYGGEDETLREMRAEAEEQGLPAIQVPFELGRLLQVLVMQSRARRILEIGTLFGYSTVLMARVLRAGGKVTTLEVAPKHAALATANFQRAGVAEHVELVLGPALDSLHDLEGQDFDFVFIDADKATYPQYLDGALRLTHPGATIVADNVWRDGAVLAPGAGNADNEGLAEFNRAVAASPRLLTSVIPTRDGRDGTSVSVVLTHS